MSNGAILGVKLAQGQLADANATAAVHQRIFGDATRDTVLSVEEMNTALDTERLTQGELGRTPLHLDGMRAFLEKRPPNFR